MTDQNSPHDDWLVGEIKIRLLRLVATSETDLVDELLILFGALKVVGFDASYRAMRLQLNAALALRDRDGAARADTSRAGLPVGTREASQTPNPKDSASSPESKTSRTDSRPSMPRFGPRPARTSPQPEPIPEKSEIPADLSAFLHSRIRGQDAAIATISARLDLVKAGLKLRPERPHGVFLFAGPTGVGKTELAQQLAVGIYGHTDALIRLDMSEYGEYEFGLSRLIGVGQGYVGQSEPKGWLTTRIAARPRSLLLLDEIEKADRRIWDTFLQVFDAGRLTDGRGNTADFSETTIILTSNLGAREAARASIGFGDPHAASGARRRAAITEAFAPELLNRLDEIVYFEPLDAATIEEIASAQLDDLTARLGEQGWSIAIDASVAPWLARTGHDPHYGARHLQRTIERELLVRLVSAPSKTVRMAIGPSDELVIE